jgi:hypothetical protein
MRCGATKKRPGRPFLPGRFASRATRLHHAEEIVNVRGEAHGRICVSSPLFARQNHHGRAEAFKCAETKQLFRKLNESIRGYWWLRHCRVGRARRGAGRLPDSTRPRQVPPGLRYGVVQSSVAPAIRIQIDTSFVADLIQNIQYDSGDHREPETILQTNWQRRLNYRAQVPLNW